MYFVPGMGKWTLMFLDHYCMKMINEILHSVDRNMANDRQVRFISFVSYFTEEPNIESSKL